MLVALPEYPQPGEALSFRRLRLGNPVARARAQPDHKRAPAITFRASAREIRLCADLPSGWCLPRASSLFGGAHPSRLRKPRGGCHEDRTAGSGEPAHLSGEGREDADEPCTCSGDPSGNLRSWDVLSGPRSVRSLRLPGRTRTLPPRASTVAQPRLSPRPQPSSCPLASPSSLRSSSLVSSLRGAGTSVLLRSSSRSLCLWSVFRGSSDRGRRSLQRNSSFRLLEHPVPGLFWEPDQMFQMTTPGTSQSLSSFILNDEFAALDLARPTAVATFEHRSHLLPRSRLVRRVSYVNPVRERGHRENYAIGWRRRGWVALPSEEVRPLRKLSAIQHFSRQKADRLTC